MVIIIIIHRSQKELIEDIPSWIVLYGRRKTGKTYLVQNFIKYTEFFFIGRDKSIFSFSRNKIIPYDTLEVILQKISEDETIVIDEFLRLDASFLDALQRLPKKGKVILISSSSTINKKMFMPNSPTLGLVKEVVMPIISLEEILPQLTSIRNPVERFELAILLREPIAINSLKNLDGDHFNTFSNYSRVLLVSINTVPSLIGEIFQEDGRLITQVYEGILRAVSIRKNTATEISTYLFDRNLIPKDNSSSIQSYLKNLVDLKIIQKIQDFNKKNKFHYFHISPLMNIFYYLDQKYSISNRNIGIEELNTYLIDRIPQVVETQIREALSFKYNLRPLIFATPKKEIDFILTSFKKAKIIGEIKWKNRVKFKEFNQMVHKLRSFQCEKKIIIFKSIPEFIDKTFVEDESIEIWDIERLINELLSNNL